MAHSKCLPCRARVWRDGSPADLCPGCGGPLEAVTDLSDLIGLRCLRAKPSAARGKPAESFEGFAEQIRATIARNDAERRRRLDAEGA
jgi:hypothetical protein